MLEAGPLQQHTYRASFSIKSPSTQQSIKGDLCSPLGNADERCVCWPIHSVGRYQIICYSLAAASQFPVYYEIQRLTK